MAEKGHDHAGGHGGGHEKPHGGSAHKSEHGGGHGGEKKEGFLKMLVEKLKNIVDFPGLIKFAAERAKIMYETAKGAITLGGDFIRRALAGDGGGGGGGHAPAHAH